MEEQKQQRRVQARIVAAQTKRANIAAAKAAADDVKDASNNKAEESKAGLAEGDDIEDDDDVITISDQEDQHEAIKGMNEDDIQMIDVEAGIDKKSMDEGSAPVYNIDDDDDEDGEDRKLKRRSMISSSKNEQLTTEEKRQRRLDAECNFRIGFGMSNSIEADDEEMNGDHQRFGSHQKKKIKKKVTGGKSDSSGDKLKQTRLIITSKDNYLTGKKRLADSPLESISDEPA